ncbi:MAG: CBS domain-containing protein [Halobacteriales archaeon]|nr:CBS domain-containing protein [Halobacteriales archaeon]
MQVNSIMSEYVTTVQPDDTAREVARVILEDETGSVVVETDTPLGIVAEYDLIKMVADDRDPNKTTASDIMSEGLITIEGSETVEEAARVMKENDIKKLPVTYGGALVGIVTATDISYAVPEIVENLNGVVETDGSR